MASSKKNVYWDTCTWLGLINEEPGKVDRCRYVIKEARSGNIQIWTSTFTLAEVFKKSCEGKSVALPETKDLDFENFIEQEFLTLVQVDLDVGVLARRLLRKHPQLKKPSDAIHLATAAMSNVDELHTTDAVNLIILTGEVKRQDGVSLTICLPPEEPPPPPMPLFDGLQPA